MKKYVILTDSASDLNKELRTRYDIEYVSMRIIYEDKDLPSSLDWAYFSAKEFYDMMRNGVRFSSSQANPAVFTEAFESFAARDCDILYVGCSSALSASYRNALTAKEEFTATHPDTKVICVDSRRGCIGLGMLAMTASQLRSEGKTIEETAAYLEEHKDELHQVGTVADLTYLRRAGRVSATSAIFGNLLQIKPIIIADCKGQNSVIEKMKGRKPSINRLVQYFADNYTEHPYQKIYIAHADCPDDVEYFKAELLKVLPNSDIEIGSEYIGTVVGASVGPGMIAVYFFGKKVTLNKED